MTSRQQRKADAWQYAGVRQVHFARSTGTLVVVVEALPANLDPGEHGETKWYTICDDHNRLIGHSTLLLAQRHSADPLGWCEVCSGNEPADDEED